MSRCRRRRRSRWRSSRCSFLYRILFLLYAEASPELGVLPTGATEYDRGYSLDRLRELTLVELTTQRSQAGTHLYDSLGVLFRLVDQGHAPTRTEQDPEGVVEGLTFRSLRADLFKPEATAHIDEVGLGNAALQQVLRHLLLSKETRGPRPRASSPTPSSASTSSARSTRA